ncbi:30S ribosomal protein S6 [Candidatus Parcubacteria bacterium]|nr:30S ribosomal protein S6 [Candidatus Parcubacteria bacterium]
MEKTEVQNDSKMKIYELGYLLVSTIAEENVAAEVGIIKALLEKHGAEFISEDFPKIRPLAFTMLKSIGSQRNRHDKGYFGWIKFETATSAMPLIKAELAKNDHILRSLIIETVRENTMVTQKMIFKPSADAPVKKEGDVEGEVKAPISEEELDKTIENLVV